MSIRRNFLYNIFYQMLITVIPLITTPYIARIIGVEGVGIQSYNYSVANYFVLVAMLGLNNHGNRSIAMVRDDKEKVRETFWSIYFLQLITGTIMSSIYIIYILFFVKENKIIAIIQLFYVLSALFDINWFFFGMEKFKMTVTRNTVIKILSLFSIFIFVKSSGDLWIYSLIISLGILINQISLWPFLKNEIKFKKVSMQKIYSQFKPTVILFIPVLSVSIYKVMDKIMIGSMSSMINVGLYENTEKIVNIPVGVITALGTVMLPKISNLIANGNTKESEKYMYQSLRFAMFISIGSTFGLMGVSSVLIPIFLGEEFMECISLVRMLSFTIIFIAWANVIRTQYLIPKQKDKIYITSTILGAIINALINLLLIGKYGAKGAVVGTMLAEATVSLYQTYKIRNEIQLNYYFKNSIVFLPPGIIMYLLIGYIGNSLPISILTGIIQIICGGTVYIIISGIILYLKKDQFIDIMLTKINLTNTGKFNLKKYF